MVLWCGGATYEQEHSSPLHSRRTNITVKEVVENGTVGSSDDDLTDPGFDDQDEAEPLLMPKLEEDYGSMGKKAKKPKKRGWSPKRGALFHRG